MVPWGHLAGLQLLITSNKALSTLMYNFVWNIPSFLWASIAGQYNSFVFSFFSDYQNGFWESVPFYIPTNSVVIFSNNLPALKVSSWSLFFSLCDRCVVASHYLIHGFGWVPPKASDIDRDGWWAAHNLRWNISLCFVHVLARFCVSSLLWLERFLSSLDFGTLSNIRFGNYFLPFYSLSLHLLHESLSHTTIWNFW